MAGQDGTGTGTGRIAEDAGAGAPFRRIAAALRDRVAGMAPGERLPSIRALVGEFGVASATASRAVALLRAEGLVQSMPRVGTVVARRGAAQRVRRSGENPSRETVVALAVELADVDGLAAVSMRRIATDLGLATTTVRGIAGGEDELLTAMLEHVFSEVRPRPARGTGWRHQLAAAARHQWEIYSAHPWAARAVSLHRPHPVPALLALAEWNLSALEEIVTDRERRFDLHLVLFGYVRGMAVTLAAEQEARADTGVDAEHFVDHDPRLRREMHRFAGPALRRAGPYVHDLDRIFHTGLTTLLDGIT
ncbi:winged helix-turn-helix domain-containing protein [Amycolatopsis sp. PS_44_ISF1]|uniref:winged helix-turn-helix domain-containing protein n=1 Tax=Amycolatopsis sp. PS_44_ISF1 TaxID=2974917 RepID=UPI0028DE6B87|nr:winged helix-turn-helix domain-containing protein [Amycolatopsis sp. PS_44_ISF1]MDT8911987.1 winged helix-turn-helix domain-containing protein [Amycolatopsis sp. PS_44_ISF1]